MVLVEFVGEFEFHFVVKGHVLLGLVGLLLELGLSQKGRVLGSFG
jgi:hypothetical protein